VRLTGLRIIQGEPNIEVKLANRLLKIFHRHSQHFKESPSEYRKQILIYFHLEMVDNECDAEEYARLGYEQEEKNLGKIFALIMRECD
jgi:hypothetical protein